MTILDQDYCLVWLDTHVEPGTDVPGAEYRASEGGWSLFDVGEVIRYIFDQDSAHELPMPHKRRKLPPRRRGWDLQPGANRG